MTETCPCEFPPVNFSCVRHLIEAARNGTLTDDPAGAIKHAACIVGSVADAFDNEAPQPLGSTGDLTLEQVATQIEAELPQAPGASPQLNPVVVNLLIVLAQKVLERLLK